MAHRPGHRGGPVAHAQLAEDPQQMGLHRRLPDEQLPPDLRVGAPLRHQPQHLRLPLREPRQLRHPAQPVHQPGRHRRREHRLAPRRGPDRVRQLAPAQVLEQIAGRPGLHRPQDVAVALVRGQHHDPARQPRRSYPADRLDAPAARHPQVHQHDVRQQFGAQGLGTGAAVGLADHVEVRLGVQHPAQPLPYDGVVVGQQDTDHQVLLRRVAGESGRVTVSEVPEPGALRTSALPPASSALARTPSRP